YTEKRRLVSLRAGVFAGLIPVPRRFHAVGRPQTESAEDDPGEKPEEIEGKTEDHGVDAVPERDRETHGEERNQSKNKGEERWFGDAHRAAIINRHVKSASRKIASREFAYGACSAFSVSAESLRSDRRSW